MSEEDYLEKEYFGNLIICLYEKLGIVRLRLLFGGNFNRFFSLDIGKEPECFDKESN